MPGLAVGDTKGAANHCYIAGSQPDSGEASSTMISGGGTGALAGSDGDHASEPTPKGIQRRSAGGESRSHASGTRGGERPSSWVLRSRAWRGGLGMERKVRLETGGAGLTVLTDRVIIPPYGVDGGTSGGGNRFTVLREDSEVEPSDVPGKATAFPLREGDAVVLRSAGGGGWGDPLARTPEAVLADVGLGYISPKMPREVYGVVIQDGTVEAAADLRCAGAAW